MTPTRATAAAAAPGHDPAPVSDVREYREVPLAQLRLSPLNPRKHFDPERLEELAASMRHGVGVLEPLVVRAVPSTDPREFMVYEIVAGARRFKAAALAGLETVPVSIRQLTDAQVLEIMVIENDQREDITPLEEAAGFKQLTSTFGFDIDRLAARIGRTRKYIYDRIKLLDLIPAAQQLLDRQRITAGHAILLARLTPTQQARAIAPPAEHSVHDRAPLFQRDASLLDDVAAAAEERAAAKDPYVGLKAKSVRDLEAWIQDHCRWQPSADVQRELYPETAAKLETARKVVHIHLGHYVQPDAREDDPQRIYGSQSWRRADGLEKSKTCDKSRLGLVTIGEGQGKAFEVCVNRECPVHFAKELREKKRRAAMEPSAAAKRQEAEQRRQQRERDEREQRIEAFKAAKPAIVAAVAEKVRSAPLSQVITQVLDRVYNLPEARAAMSCAHDGSAELALRLVWLGDLLDECAPYQADHFGKTVKKLLGINVAAIIKAQAAAAAVPAPAKAHGGAKRKAAKKR